MNLQYHCHVFSFMTELKEAPATLTSIGIESRFGHDYYYDNRHRPATGYLFQYTISGHGLFYDGDKKMIVGTNQGVFIPMPSNTKYCCDPNASEPWIFIFIHVTGDCFKEYYENIYAKNGYILSLPTDALPIKLLFDISNQTINGHIRSFSQGSRLAFDFITRLYDYYFDNKEIYSKRNREIIDILENSFKDIESISDIADKFGISTSHMTREFTNETGISPIKYLTKTRIQNAKMLLNTTTKSVHEIATECGYKQTNYFCKIFKENVGMSPLEYRDYLS